MNHRCIQSVCPESGKCRVFEQRNDQWPNYSRFQLFLAKYLHQFKETLLVRRRCVSSCCIDEMFVPSKERQTLNELPYLGSSGIFKSVGTSPSSFAPAQPRAANIDPLLFTALSAGAASNARGPIMPRQPSILPRRHYQPCDRAAPPAGCAARKNSLAVNPNRSFFASTRRRTNHWLLAKPPPPPSADPGDRNQFGNPLVGRPLHRGSRKPKNKMTPAVIPVADKSTFLLLRVMKRNSCCPRPSLRQIPLVNRPNLAVSMQCETVQRRTG